MPRADRLAFSTNAFKKTTLHDALRHIADAGYAGCEVMADQPHLTPTDFSTRDLDTLATLIDDLGLEVSNVNAFTGFFAAGDAPTGDTYHPTWIEEDPEKIDTRVAHTLASIRLAAALGCCTVSLQPGGPTIGTGLTAEKAARRFADGIARCLPTARELGVMLAVEPEPGLLLQTTGEYVRWKHTHFPDEPLVTMNYDVGHAFCVDEDPAAVARERAGQYAHVHLEDIAASRVHQHLVPGEGAVDFRALFDALDAAAYDGWVTVELYPFMNDPGGVARRAFEYLRPLVR